MEPVDGSKLPSFSAFVASVELGRRSDGPLTPAEGGTLTNSVASSAGSSSLNSETLNGVNQSVETGNGEGGQGEGQGQGQGSNGVLHMQPLLNQPTPIGTPPDAPASSAMFPNSLLGSMNQSIHQSISASLSPSEISCDPPIPFPFNYGILHQDAFQLQQHIQNRLVQQSDTGMVSASPLSTQHQIPIHSLNPQQQLQQQQPPPQQQQQSSNHHQSHFPAHNRSFACSHPGCGKQFAYLSILKVHTRVHTGDRPHKCTLCENSYTTSSRLKIHMRSHTNEAPYICEYPNCGKRFKSNSNLAQHSRVHMDKREREEFEARNKRTIVCKVCGNLYKTVKSMDQHFWREHVGKGGDRSDGGGSKGNGSGSGSRDSVRENENRNNGSSSSNNNGVGKRGMSQSAGEDDDEDDEDDEEEVDEEED
ncbi:hypothetical protein BCR33DRAFT_766685 [Rhizoclosmatium globosum]|uniref:C2H2-type domain-containing protein n=1 Tax=Rhizoclosmatium globosum TaxID=329046 RepID=A0A1Y2C998_9FUNG|nr:hypothetical protein BCR33DRAFT_766685 [Rhizoclosmatium globosum]|eukprot:ORY43516.1 hypothetical protein BCR33DRAFT_766685 [Rhizoclosmatium globosum]